MSLEIENENRLLKETIIELRARLEALYADMQKKVEMERIQLGRINLQLESTIQTLREELVNSVLTNQEEIEEIKKAKNQEIYQLQAMIIDLRKALESCNGIKAG